MCGIFGAVFVKTPVDVDRALARLHHRGPDHQASFRDEHAVLGHARLSILDLSAAAHQPMASASGDVVVVFNGEIYNHHQLRRELEERGHELRTRSDTEVIVEGYRAWGDGVVRRLDGMFAFAVWDARRHRVLVARDRAGKKPLFYHDGPRLFAFAIRLCFCFVTFVLPFSSRTHDDRLLYPRSHVLPCFASAGRWARMRRRWLVCCLLSSVFALPSLLPLASSRTATTEAQHTYTCVVLRNTSCVAHHSC